MKVILATIFAIMFLNVFGQTFEKILSKNESYYLLSIKDTLDLSIKFPDGRYKVVKERDSFHNKYYAFNLKDNKIDGPYLEIISGFSWIFGNYTNDSLWTFYNDPANETFKTGKWEEFCVLMNRGSRTYKIPFNNDSIYTEYSEYHDGGLRRESKYKKGFGLIEETYWNEDSTLDTKESINKVFSIKLKYFKDSLQNVSITQKKLVTELELNVNENGRRFYDKRSLSLNVYNLNDSINVQTPLGYPHFAIDLDKDLHLLRLDERFVPFSIFYDFGNKLKLRYKNQRGIIKYIKIK